MKKADYTLRYDKCTSTSEQEVTNRLNGYEITARKRNRADRCSSLAEKFSIKGHHDLSKALLTHNKEFLKSSRPLGEQGTNVRVN